MWCGLGIKSRRERSKVRPQFILLLLLLLLSNFLVLSIRTFSTEQEALAMANDTNYGLAAGVVTQDVERLARVSRHLKAGIVWENCNQNCYPEG